MNGIRFGWIGESRQAALLQLVEAEVVEWSRDWGVHHVPEEIKAHCKGQGELGSAVRYLAEDASGTLAICLGGKDMDAVGRQLAGTTDGADAGWAQRIGQEALQALADRLFARAGGIAAPRLSESLGSPDLVCTRFGATHIGIAFGRLAWGLILDRRLADHLAPPRQIRDTHGHALAPRTAAMDSVRLRIGAILDFGSVNLTDLSDLQVGEILVGERSLQDVLQIQVDGHGVVAAGYLKRSGTQRAVMLYDHSQPGNES